jgi:phosphonoacetate hydrolase
MQGRSLARDAREEPQKQRYSAGMNGFIQHVDLVEQDGRRFILGGGQ